MHMILISSLPCLLTFYFYGNWLGRNCLLHVHIETESEFSTKPLDKRITPSVLVTSSNTIHSCKQNFCYLVGRWLNILHFLKVTLQRTFLFQQMNGLCTCITKIVIIFLKNKAAFLCKKTFVNILCYNDQPGTILKFIEFLRLCHSQQCHPMRDKLVPVCVRIIV